MNLREPWGFNPIMCPNPRCRREWHGLPMKAESYAYLQTIREFGECPGSYLYEREQKGQKA
jgi:hypothetical protein